MILVSTIGFSGMPDLVVWSEITLDIALWVKYKMAAFVQGQTINSYHFQNDRGKFVFLVSIMGFSGTPYIVVLSEDILHIALWVKNSRWPPFVQGPSIN